MGQYAHVLVGDSDPDIASKRLQALENAGYGGFKASDAKSLESLASDRHPDVIVMGRFNNPGSLAIAKQLRKFETTAHIPIFMIDADGTEETRSQAVAAGLADMLEGQTEDATMLNRLSQIVRLSAMLKEVERRALTSKELGRPVDISSIGKARGADPYKILMVAESSEEDADVYASTLSDGFDSHLEQDPYRAISRVERSRFDAFALVESKNHDREKLVYFCNHIRNNVDFSNIPILVIACGDETEFYRAGASIVMPHNRDTNLVSTYLYMLVNRLRFQVSLEQPFNEIRGPETTDKTVPLAFSEKFYTRHLARSLADAAERKADLSTCVISIPTIKRIHDTHGADNAAMLQYKIVDWVIGLVRADDTVGLIDKGDIAIILPGADEREAIKIAHRITGIIQNSEYALGEEVMEAIHVIAKCGTATATADESAENLLDRTRENVL